MFLIPGSTSSRSAPFLLSVFSRNVPSHHTSSLDSPLCRMSWYSSRPIRQSSSSPMLHFLEHQSGQPTQASVSAQGAAAQAKVMLMLGPTWLPSSPPPRHRPPHHQKAQFPWLRCYSSGARSSVSQGRHPSFLRMHTRPLLASCRLAGTLRSQLRRDAKPGM